MPGVQTRTNSTDNLGRWVRQFRNIHNLRQRDLAKMIGVSPAIISLMETRGFSHAAIQKYIRVADVMGITIDTMLEPLDTEKIRHRSDTFEAIIRRSHAIAVSKEWWRDFDEAPRRFKPYVLATKIALIASEVSEAMEAARENHYPQHTVDGKPEGVVVELADAIIRIFDFCEKLGLDLKGALLDKLDFNETRPVKHGKVF